MILSIVFEFLRTEKLKTRAVDVDIAQFHGHYMVSSVISLIFLKGLQAVLRFFLVLHNNARQKLKCLTRFYAPRQSVICQINSQVSWFFQVSENLEISKTVSVNYKVKYLTIDRLLIKENQVTALGMLLDR